MGDKCEFEGVILRFTADDAARESWREQRLDPCDSSNESEGVDTHADSSQDHRLVPRAGSNGNNEEAMMRVVRVAACVVTVATVNCWSGAAAQSSSFTCEDFLTQTAAQTLEAQPERSVRT